MKQLLVNFPNDPDFQPSIVQELIDAVFDLLSGDDGLHHDARVGVLLGVVVTVLGARQELHHLQLVSGVSEARPPLGFPHQEGSPPNESQMISRNLVDISQVERESQRVGMKISVQQPAGALAVPALNRNNQLTSPRYCQCHYLVLCSHQPHALERNNSSTKGNYL